PLPLPAGLVYDRVGTIVLNPDEEVQAPSSSRVCQIPGTAKRSPCDALLGQERIVLAGSAVAWAISTRDRLACAR
ncbi:hypothetical protein, partial [Bradyrhizobium elkanii]|uniref:hypothetical protein n=1 Tax=Bradyrhizobium elkanii TaxID=29448 RepID=UPI001AEBC541